jgi:hypothetical protein
VKSTTLHDCIPSRVQLPSQLGLLELDFPRMLPNMVRYADHRIIRMTCNLLRPPRVPISLTHLN